MSPLFRSNDLEMEPWSEEFSSELYQSESEQMWEEFESTSWQLIQESQEFWMWVSKELSEVMNIESSWTSEFLM